MSDLIKRLDAMAKELQASLAYSRYCQLIYTASVELAAKDAEIALLRKDAERLAKLCNPDFRGIDCYDVIGVWIEPKDLRAAIDKAKQ